MVEKSSFTAFSFVTVMGEKSVQRGTYSSLSTFSRNRTNMRPMGADRWVTLTAIVPFLMALMESWSTIAVPILTLPIFPPP